MTCHHTGGAMICCARERRRRCSMPHCNGFATKLCDYPVRNGKTCDAALCDVCAVNVGADRDFCPAHARSGQMELLP